MEEENITQEFRLKKIEETRNYFIEDMNWNELMSKNHEKVCATLNHQQHFLILGSTITGYVSISAFTSLVAILTGITSSEFGLKICAVLKYLKNISQ